MDDAGREHQDGAPLLRLVRRQVNDELVAVFVGNEGRDESCVVAGVRGAAGRDGHHFRQHQVAGGHQLVVRDPVQAGPDAQVEQRRQPVRSGRRGSEAEAVSACHAGQHVAEGSCGNVVTFIRNDSAKQAAELLEVGAIHRQKGLDHGDGDDLGRHHSFTDRAGLHIQTVADGLTPLLQQVVRVDEHDGRLPDPADDCHGDPGLAAAARHLRVTLEMGCQG